MLKRNKKIAQICALAMCINLVQGSFANGYASEIGTDNAMSQTETEASAGVADSSSNEVNNGIESDSNVINQSESETSEEVKVSNDKVSVEADTDLKLNGITSNNIHYELLSDNTLGVKDATGNEEKNLVIPDYIEKNGVKYPVTKIESNSFIGCSDSIKTLKLGRNITTIEANSFDRKNDIYKYAIPGNVKNIEKNAFGDNYGDFIAESEEVQNLLINSGIYKSQIEIQNLDDYDLTKMYWSYGENSELGISGDFCKDYDNDLRYYKIDDNSVGITSIGCNWDGIDTLVVPSTIEVSGKMYTVTHLYKRALGQACRYKKVILPDSITQVDDAATDGCGAEEVILPDSITSMGEKQLFFNFFTKIIKLPKNLEEINNYFLYGSLKLPEVTWPENLKKIGDYCFVGKRYGESEKSLQLPDSIEKIGNFSFIFHENIEELKLPSNLKEIGSGTFRDMKIEKLELPENLDEIGRGCFSECPNLKEIKLPSNIKRIGVAHPDEIVSEDIFNIAGSLEDIPGAFAVNESLEHVEIPDSVEQLGYGCFGYCSNLKYIKLSANLKSSEGGLCAGCTSLESIVIPEGFESLGGSDFSGCSNLKEVKLPSSLKKIGEYAFSDDTSLESIVIPDSVEEIGNNAFEGCDNLTFNVSSERVKNLLLNANSQIDESRIVVTQ